MKQLFLDIETTGFSREWNEIIELAAVLYDDETNTVEDEFHMYAKPSKGVPANITELTGITNGMLENCGSERDMMIDFCSWFDDIGADVIIGHNCKTFDIQFIDAKCNKYKLEWLKQGKEIIDTLTLARQLKKKGLINVANCKQTTIGEYFNIKYNAHSALADVKALISIYNKMKQCETPDRSALGF